VYPVDKFDIAYKYDIVACEIDNCYVTVTLSDRRKVSMPFDWFPFLENATEEQLTTFRVTGGSVLWELLDEGFSLEPVILGQPD
jgi:hypothetical protein